MSNAKGSKPPRPSTASGGPTDAPKQVKVTMAFPIPSFHKTFYFNRFRLEPVDSYVLMTFALARSSGEILCCSRSLVSKPEINDTKQSLTSFMASQLEGVDVAHYQAFEPPPVSPNSVDMPIINQINVGVQPERNSAEIVLSRFSMLTVANVSRMESSEKPVIPVEGIALLRCELPLFKLFLVRLYEAAEGAAP